MMLPEKFKARMMALLGDEYEKFERALIEVPSKRGIRVNPIKTSDEDICEELKIPEAKIPYVKGAYFLPDGYEGIGLTPSHHAGRIYVQDPGAMATAASVTVEPDFFVADLCAAPGGKSTQAASYLGEGGFILSNEYVPKRAKMLVGNFERMGIRCGMVTSLDTAKLRELFDSFFDLVIADAPCSGEGMFRKDVPAIEEWSEENVKLCAERQRDILRNGADMVKSGGVLVYSTCTYSLEENEMIIDAFLSERDDFSIVDTPEAIKCATADGIVFDGAKHGDELKLCRRFYPHISDGEGQFIAVLKRTGGSEPQVNFKDSAKPLSRDEKAAVDTFLRENLTDTPKGRIVKVGEQIYIIEHNAPIPPYGVFCPGVLLGEVRGKLLFPSHQFFSAYGNLFVRQENITDESFAKSYLKGEEIDAKSFSQSGFCSVLWRGSPLGGGKASGGKIKNHYPKGLRNK